MAGKLIELTTPQSSSVLIKDSGTGLPVYTNYSLTHLKIVSMNYEQGRKGYSEDGTDDKLPLVSFWIAKGFINAGPPSRFVEAPYIPGFQYTLDGVAVDAFLGLATAVPPSQYLDLLMQLFVDFLIIPGTIVNDPTPAI